MSPSCLSRRTPRIRFGSRGVMLRMAGGLALLCILLRGFIPSGYMPDLDQSRERWFALVLCAGAGPMPMPVAMSMPMATGDHGAADLGHGAADVGHGAHGAAPANAHPVADADMNPVANASADPVAHPDADAGDPHHDTMMHAGQDCPFAVAAVQPFVGGVPAVSTLTVPVRVVQLAPVPPSQHILPPPRAPPLGSRAPPSITV